MLIYDIGRPTEPKDGGTVLVLLHGRGSHRGDLQALRPALPDDWTLVTPQAPHPGHEWGYGPGWAWYRHLGADRVDGESLEFSLNAVDLFLNELPTLVRFQPGKVVLGGFSQGGTMGTVYALTRPDRIAGALNFSGFLPSSVEVPFSALSPDTPPIFWAHGTQDTGVPFQLAIGGRERLRAGGIRLTAHDYEIGHWIVQEEVEAALAFVEGL